MAVHAGCADSGVDLEWWTDYWEFFWRSNSVRASNSPGISFSIGCINGSADTGIYGASESIEGADTGDSYEYFRTGSSGGSNTEISSNQIRNK